MAGLQNDIPAHIEESVRAIAEVHADHHRQATPIQRAVERLTRVVGRPRFIGWLTAAILVWLGLNLILQPLGRAFDPAPFPMLQAVVTLVALYITVLILITQRRENQLAEHRDQLTLELAVLNEQKSAKIIQLLEELRRDSPEIADRHDPEAEALAVPADPQMVLEAIKDTHEEVLAIVAEEIAEAAAAASDPAAPTSH
jgi:uncharacterized membrane protein